MEALSFPLTAVSNYAAVFTESHFADAFEGVLVFISPVLQRGVGGLATTEGHNDRSPRAEARG